MKLLTNHIGYKSHAPKKAVFQGECGMTAGNFRIVDASTGEAAYHGRACACGPVAGWHTGEYWTLAFSDFQTEGTWRLELETDRGRICSDPFDILEFFLPLRMISGVAYWFKGQRSSGEWLERDRRLPFDGPRAGVVDVHGGWYDATGDYGIHLSHLSHSTYHNPQQASLTALVFFRMGELLEASGNEQYTMVRRRLLDEAFWGADFLMRMRAPSGTFFRSISRGDAFGSPAAQRTLGFSYKGSSSQFGHAATAAEEAITDESYEASLRCGAGHAIAALAAASRFVYPGADHMAQAYLEAAQAAWRWLETHNEAYTNDGRWNLVDEYCALEALTELYRASREYDDLRKGRAMADRILARLVEQPDGTAWFDMNDGKPFHHAADAGLPVVALLAFRDIEPDPARRATLLAACERAMGFELAVTDEVANPFGYARYLYRDNADGQLRRRFFFPHNSNAAPWWQGDNARIASLATAASFLARRTGDGALRDRLCAYAENQLDWIMGCNPFDSCMIEAYGRNNIQYFFNGRYDFLNAPGGICNGITSGLDDEDGIEFVTRPTGRVTDNWRWAEQWIPHGTWYLYAMAMGTVPFAGMPGRE